VRQTGLTSLIGLLDSDGDRLMLVRLDRPNGKRDYILRVGTGSVLLSADDLRRVSAVIRFELALTSRLRYVARAIWFLVLCGLMWLLTNSVIGPLFAYPWSN
jgi:hypothetical protein